MSGRQNIIKEPKKCQIQKEIYRKFSVDISIRDLPLHRTIVGLWVIGVFMRVDKVLFLRPFI